ncbi:MAG TPA: hypothetical protein VII20_16425 [Roseiarcus sp.]|jgi:hypothetical protein
MSEQPLTFDQIQTMRMAIDMAASALGPHVSRRAKIVSAIVPYAGLDGHSAATLANLALEQMGLAIRVSDDEHDKARESG